MDWKLCYNFLSHLLCTAVGGIVHNPLIVLAYFCVGGGGVSCPKNMDPRGPKLKLWCSAVEPEPAELTLFCVDEIVFLNKKNQRFLCKFPSLIFIP